MKKIDVSGKNLDSIIFTLLAAKANGESVCCNFHEHVFLSDTITFDSAYQMVYGMSREEYDDKLLEMYQEHDKKMKEMGIESSAVSSLEIRKDLFRAAGVIYPEDGSKKTNQKK